MEIDEEALAVCRRHALLNGAPVRLVRGDGARPMRTRAFDTVLANLTAPLLAERAGELTAGLRPEGTLVVSGFLHEDVPSLRRAFAVHGALEVHTEGGWAAVVVRRS
jgi:ribosomal protein L11 methyltransferase